MKNIKSILALFCALMLICLTGCGDKASNENTSTGEYKVTHTATIKVKNHGTIELELYGETAPITVANFEKLANQKFYDGLTFHRVIEGFMIQGGDPLGKGIGGPGYGIYGEFKQNGFDNDLAHKRGVLSMARSMMPNSAGSQFFIMHMDAPYLDGAYAAFGCVTSGMDVVDEIATTKTDYTDRPLKQQKIEKMTVETFGVEYPAPKTL